MEQDHRGEECREAQVVAWVEEEVEEEWAGTAQEQDQVATVSAHVVVNELLTSKAFHAIPCIVLTVELP